MRKIWVVLLLAPLLLVSTVAAGPLYSPESLARYFRLDWQVVPGSGGPTLEGYVYNQTDMLAISMLVNIEELDAAGNVLRQVGARVLGEVPPGNRSFFSARVHQAASYRVAVLSFNWLDKNVGN
jgi:hypothetical protein